MAQIGEVTAFHGASLEVGEGELLAVSGPTKPARRRSSTCSQRMVLDRYHAARVLIVRPRRRRSISNGAARLKLRRSMESGFWS